MKKPMLTLSQVMARLAKKKIVREYRMNERGEMKLSESEKNYRPEELKILRSYRFEGDSNPDDSAVLYIAEDNHGNIGMIIDSYGAESNYPGEQFANFIRKIPVNEIEEYNFD